MSPSPDPSRRQLLAAAAVSALPASMAGQVQASPQATSGSSQPADSETRPDTPFAEVDIDAAGRLIGRTYAEAERKMMQAGLVRSRDVMTRLRAREIPPGVEHAVIFEPILPGH